MENTPKNLDPEKETAKFMVSLLNDPESKKNPAMVEAIAGLYKVLAEYHY